MWKQINSKPTKMLHICTPHCTRINANINTSQIEYINKCYIDKDMIINTIMKIHFNIVVLATPKQLYNIPQGPRFNIELYNYYIFMIDS